MKLREVKGAIVYIPLFCLGCGCLGATSAIDSFYKGCALVALGIFAIAVSLAIELSITALDYWRQKLEKDY